MRTDLPAELLAHVAHGMLEGLDRYALQNMETLVADGIDAVAGVYITLLRGVLAPR